VCARGRNNTPHYGVLRFSREIWYQMLSLVGLQQCSPRPSDTVFQEWQASELQVAKQHRKGLNSLVAVEASECMCP
jgi:hypothetical protein